MPEFLYYVAVDVMRLRIPPTVNSFLFLRPASLIFAVENVGRSTQNPQTFAWMSFSLNMLLSGLLLVLLRRRCLNYADVYLGRAGYSGRSR